MFMLRKVRSTVYQGIYILIIYIYIYKYNLLFLLWQNGAVGGLVNDTLILFMSMCCMHARTEPVDGESQVLDGLQHRHEASLGPRHLPQVHHLMATHATGSVRDTIVSVP
jgi:hypothetical protein